MKTGTNLRAGISPKPEPPSARMFDPQPEPPGKIAINPVALP